jgi:hypothetical protein
MQQVVNHWEQSSRSRLMFHFFVERGEQGRDVFSQIEYSMSQLRVKHD